jgi:hypothetical protein
MKPHLPARGARTFLSASAILLTAALSLFAADEILKIQGHVSRTAGPGTNLVLRTDSGATYNLKRGPASEALFVDTNLWPKHLLLSGKLQDNSFEVTGNLRSIKDGKVHELFYYCDVCSVSTSVPGLCVCCREPTVLTEKPEHTD